MKLRVAFAASMAFFSTGCASAPQRSEAQPAIAITIDDLPEHGPYPRGETAVSAARAIALTLKVQDVEAYAFINGAKAEADPATAEALTVWRDAGLPFGNHGWAHRHLSEMSAAEFEQELIRNEPLLRSLSPNADWKWFRYPFLDEGENEEKHAAAREVLARHGYKVAAVRMDFSDWQWAAPYARCKDAGDHAAVARLEELFLQSAREKVAYYQSLSNAVYGRDIPYVLLLHVSAFEARMLPRLLDLYRSEGFKFVSLPEAQADPAYSDQTQPTGEAPEANEITDAIRATLPKRTDFEPILASMCSSTVQ